MWHAILLCSERVRYGMHDPVVSWKISDVIDFEWLLAEDGEVDDAASRARDAELSAKISQVWWTACMKDRRDLFRAWLDARRSHSSETPPGEYFLTAWQLLSVLSALTGAGLGMSVAAAFLLAYTGDEPVNVGWFFGLTGRRPVAHPYHGTSHFGSCDARRTFSKIFGRSARSSPGCFGSSAALQQLPGERRETMRARLMGIRRKGEVFQLLVWPLLMITQIFGIFFNVGVLIALLLPLGRDVAFGWQSTLKTSPETVYRLVSTIAAPWSFLPNAHPTYEDSCRAVFPTPKASSPCRCRQ